MNVRTRLSKKNTNNMRKRNVLIPGITFLIYKCKFIWKCYKPLTDKSSFTINSAYTPLLIYKCSFTISNAYTTLSIDKSSFTINSAYTTLIDKCSFTISSAYTTISIVTVTSILTVTIMLLVKNI